MGVKAAPLKILGSDTQVCTKQVTAQLGNCPKDQVTQLFTLTGVGRKLGLPMFCGLRWDGHKVVAALVTASLWPRVLL